ncbi:lysozyme [Xenorhabdus ehlersii]|uniref:Lysozyme n=1 Tax=Xenorhabdus ehlersii TaxID=290111 RepID=A0A2D0IL79_9GAMM|nr:lysozyme [Xenorhabdus ehlersii]PHM22549.1 lysozyme [Xenorhabdus ehlersii]RKE91425.1 lysozyme [Xenorhabdus ehlersii]
MEMKSRLSAAVIAAILAGAGSEIILAQFLNEKEGNRLSAYQDAGGMWTICRGITRVQGAPVRRGMTLTAQQCDALNRIEARRAIDWVKHHVQVPLTEPQIAGIASFCPYNIGPARCFSSTFYRKLNAGDKRGACAEIPRWIFDGGHDCRKTKGQANGCYGQVERRAQEAALTCWGLDK